MPYTKNQHPESAQTNQSASTRAPSPRIRIPIMSRTHQSVEIRQRGFSKSRGFALKYGWVVCMTDSLIWIDCHGVQ